MGDRVISNHSAIGAGAVLRGKNVPPRSLVTGNPSVIKVDQYRNGFETKGFRMKIACELVKCKKFDTTEDQVPFF